MNMNMNMNTKNYSVLMLINNHKSYPNKTAVAVVPSGVDTFKDIATGKVIPDKFLTALDKTKHPEYFL